MLDGVHDGNPEVSLVPKFDGHVVTRDDHILVGSAPSDKTWVAGRLVLQNRPVKVAVTTVTLLLISPGVKAMFWLYGFQCSKIKYFGGLMDFD